MVKIPTVFASLVIIGGAISAALFLYSTLRADAHSYAHEVRRKTTYQRAVIFPDTWKRENLVLKHYRSQKLVNRPLKIDSPEPVNVPHDRAPVASTSIKRSVRQQQKNSLDVFISSHRGLGLEQSHDRDELNDAVELATRFPFRSGFSFPQPKIMRTLDDISKAPWVTDLRSYLRQYNSSREISLVTSNSKYTDVLLNWLISATVKSGIPAESILVISLDKAVHRLMLSKQFCSILVPPRTLIDESVTFSEPFEEVMMTRLAVMRIINHFGYDFVMYDSDAVILKDPQPLYDAVAHEDIIGSVGKIPYDLAAEWGITICIGVVLVRSSPRTETYWNSMQDTCLDSVDDQEKLNCGLKALQISWLNNDSSYQDTTVRGIGGNRLRVSILPYNYICRQLTCIAENRAEYFIWHKGGQRSRRDKLVSAREGQTWFLKYQWEKNSRSSLVGAKWLESIAYYTVLHA